MLHQHCAGAQAPGTGRTETSWPLAVGRLISSQSEKRYSRCFMAGAASHIDLFDYKPDLVKYHGQPADFGEPIEAFQDGLGPLKKPVLDFKQYGQCGKHLSDVVADLGKCVDDLAFIHNMVGKSGVHSTATLLQSTGFTLPGFSGMGAGSVMD